MSKDLEGKVVLLTGATEGVGKAAAPRLAELGATLVLVARNREKGVRVVSELKRQQRNAEIELLLADLSRIADVQATAATFRAKYSRLDVLANNAGAVFAEYRTSADGFEMTFALNHLAYFGLTLELLDVLQKTPGARVVSTSSHAHRRGRVDLATIATRPNGKAGFQAYSDSKLANVLFTRELARRLLGTGVTANCFHPGFVHSGFGTNNPGLYGTAIGLLSSFFGRTPEEGAETLVWLASSSTAGDYSGEYFFDCKVARTASAANNEQLAKDLWALSETLYRGRSS